MAAGLMTDAEWRELVSDLLEALEDEIRYRQDNPDHHELVRERAARALGRAKP